MVDSNFKSLEKQNPPYLTPTHQKNKIKKICNVKNLGEFRFSPLSPPPFFFSFVHSFYVFYLRLVLFKALMFLFLRFNKKINKKNREKNLLAKSQRKWVAHRLMELSLICDFVLFVFLFYVSNLDVNLHYL